VKYSSTRCPQAVDVHREMQRGHRDRKVVTAIAPGTEGGGAKGEGEGGGEGGGGGGGEGEGGGGEGEGGGGDVVFIWWGFLIRRMVLDPRYRKVLDKRWGKDGVDWYEPIAFDCHTDCATDGLSDTSLITSLMASLMASDGVPHQARA
jgi:hypothetical protein